MDLVIDIQSCRGAKGEIVPKEVAVMALNSDFSAHWMVTAPYTAKKLPSKIKGENNWLALQHHGIHWYDGDVTQKNLNLALKEITRSARKIYLRGANKVDILLEIIANDIIDLSKDPDSPSFHNMPWSTSYCMYHGLKANHLSFSCALNNASRLKEWLNKKRNGDLRWSNHEVSEHADEGTQTTTEQPAKPKNRLVYPDSRYRTLCSKPYPVGVSPDEYPFNDPESEGHDEVDSTTIQPEALE